MPVYRSAWQRQNLNEDIKSEQREIAQALYRQILVSCVAVSHTLPFIDSCIPPVIQNPRLYFKLTAQRKPRAQTESGSLCSLLRLGIPLGPRFAGEARR